MASGGNFERFLIFSAFLKNHDRKKNLRRDCGKPCFWAFQAKPETVGRLWETCFWFSMGFPWSSNPGAGSAKEGGTNDRINLSKGFFTTGYIKMLDCVYA
jgi:hypothetical protein